MIKTNKEGRPDRISIDTGTIFRVLALVLGAILLYFLKDIVIILLVAFLIAIVIVPVAAWIEKRRLPRGLAVVGVYFAALAVLSLILLLIVPSIYEQSRNLSEQYSTVINDSFDWGSVAGVGFFNQDFISIVENLRGSGASDVVNQAVRILSSIFGGIIALILVLVLGYYMVVEEKAITNGLKIITPIKHQHFLESLLKEGRRKVGCWVRGQLILMFIIGLLDYILLSALGVPFALLLAILGGLLEAVPYLGPNLAALPAVIIAFSISPTLAVIVAVGYFLIQQVETGVLTPKIMQGVTGLNPIISIVSILVGFKIAGIFGALLAIPLAVLGTVFVNQWLSFYKK